MILICQRSCFLWELLFRCLAEWHDVNQRHTDDFAEAPTYPLGGWCYENFLSWGLQCHNWITQLACGSALTSLSMLICEWQAILNVCVKKGVWRREYVYSNFIHNPQQKEAGDWNGFPLNCEGFKFQRDNLSFGSQVWGRQEGYEDSWTVTCPVWAQICHGKLWRTRVPGINGCVSSKKNTAILNPLIKLYRRLRTTSFTIFVLKLASTSEQEEDFQKSELILRSFSIFIGCLQEIPFLIVCFELAVNHTFSASF